MRSPDNPADRARDRGREIITLTIIENDFSPIGNIGSTNVDQRRVIPPGRWNAERKRAASRRARRAASLLSESKFGLSPFTALFDNRACIFHRTRAAKSLNAPGRRAKRWSLKRICEWQAGTRGPRGPRAGVPAACRSRFQHSRYLSVFLLNVTRPFYRLGRKKRRY